MLCGFSELLSYIIENPISRVFHRIKSNMEWEFGTARPIAVNHVKRNVDSSKLPRRNVN